VKIEWCNEDVLGREETHPEEELFMVVGNFFNQRVHKDYRHTGNLFVYSDLDGLIGRLKYILPERTKYTKRLHSFCISLDNKELTVFIYQRFDKDYFCGCQDNICIFYLCDKLDRHSVRYMTVKSRHSILDINGNKIPPKLVIIV